MKLGEDVLVSIIEAFRKGITDGVDISDLLRELDLVPDQESNRLKLGVQPKDVWSKH